MADEEVTNEEVTEEEPTEEEEVTEEEPVKEERTEGTSQGFKTLKSFEKKYGTKNFIEVALKETEGNKFFNVAKGFYDRAGSKRYKVSIGFTADDEMKSFVVDSFQNL
jgi:hypothetical protein